MRNDLTKKLYPYYFIAPVVLFFILFMAYPIIETLVVSFFDWQGINKPPFETFIGLLNYKELWTDRIFLLSLRNTAFFVIGTVVIQNLYAYFLALLVYFGKFKFSTLIRAIIFFPTLLAVVIVGLIWRQMLTIDGLANFILNSLGIDSVAFLANWKISLWVMIFVSAWQWGGYYMVIFYAGLQSVDPQLIEAAKLDGAGLMTTITRIVTPNIRASIIIAVTLAALGGFRVFDIVYIMTFGGPARSTYVFSMYIYYLTFGHYGTAMYSYASSIVTFFFFVIVLVTSIRIRDIGRRGLKE
jgi:ABC-type sugar transport system permease subunit